MREPFARGPLRYWLAGGLLENLAKNFPRFGFSKRAGARSVRGLLDSYAEFYRIIAVSLLGGLFEPTAARIPVTANPEWRPRTLYYEHSATISATFNSVQ